MCSCSSPLLTGNRHRWARPPSGPSGRSCGQGSSARPQGGGAAMWTAEYVWQLLQVRYFASSYNWALQVMVLVICVWHKCWHTYADGSALIIWICDALVICAWDTCGHCWLILLIHVNSHCLHLVPTHQVSLYGIFVSGQNWSIFLSCVNAAMLTQLEVPSTTVPPEKFSGGQSEVCIHLLRTILSQFLKILPMITCYYLHYLMSMKQTCYEVQFLESVWIRFTFSVWL